MQDVNNSVLVIKNKTMRYPRSYYQFKALRNSWNKSKSEMKDTMVQMLTQSMNEVVELYNLEQDAMNDLTDWKSDL